VVKLQGGAPEKKGLNGPNDLGNPREQNRIRKGGDKKRKKEKALKTLK